MISTPPRKFVDLQRAYLNRFLFPGGLPQGSLSSGQLQPKGSILIASNSEESSTYFSINFVIMVRVLSLL